MPEQTLKVLHLNAGNMYGGIETALGTLARLQVNHPSIEFEYGLCFPGRHRDELIASGSVVHDLSSVRLSRPWTVWRARRRLAQILLRSSPDIVVTHGSWIHTIASPRVRSKKLPLATWIHGVIDSKSKLDQLASKTPPDLLIANSSTPLRRLDTSIRNVEP